MLYDLTQRRPALEEMDAPNVDPKELERALRSLVRMNGIGNVANLFWPSLHGLCKEIGNGGPLRVLDVGCGAGDLSRRLERRARQAGLALQVDGCDRNPIAIDLARRENKAAECRGEFFVCDAVTGEFPGDYDVIISSLFLHHLSREGSVQVLAHCREAARKAVLVSDLLRSQFGLILVYTATRLFSRSPIVHKDGVTSLLAAYTLPEVEALAHEANLTGATLHRRWPERFLLEWHRPGQVMGR